MKARWPIGPRFICVSLIVIVALALIPSAPDTVVAQGTNRAAVCQSIARIMPRLLQTAERLRQEQAQYQKDLEDEYLFLNALANTMLSGDIFGANASTKKKFLDLLKGALQLIQQ